VVRQYLTAGHIDSMHIAISPALLGEGEHLLSGINLLELGFTEVTTVSSENAMHVLIGKSVES
jgi:dihydrofolate reductase